MNGLTSYELIVCVLASVLCVAWAASFAWAWHQFLVYFIDEGTKLK